MTTPGGPVPERSSRPGPAAAARRVTGASPAQPAHVGFLCNAHRSTSPITNLVPGVLNRALMIDERLQESGLRLFVYSPRYVTTSGRNVPGYLIENRKFVPTTAPVPRVNANWTSKSRRRIDKGMGYKKFLSWIRENRIEIYTPYEFSDLVSNKLRTYEVVARYHASLHPHTERYDHSAAQIESFLGRGDAVFLKPSSGNMGNDIVVLSDRQGGFALTHHVKGERNRFEIASLEDAVPILREIAADRRYVIQQGVETMRIDGSAFDVRVVMVHDGSSWHWVHETRVGARGGDLSNVNQGGRSMETSAVLVPLLGAGESDRVMEEIRETSYGLAIFLESLYPDGLMEIAFDFLLDRAGGLHLGEINTKPGLTVIPPGSTILNRSPDEEDLYDRYIVPHMTWLAGFLRTKAERRSARAA